MENVPKWSAACDANNAPDAPGADAKAKQEADAKSPTAPAAAAAGGSSSSSSSSDIPSLEATIHHHQSLYEGMCQAYTEVHSTSKKLLYQLDHLVQLCSQTKEDGSGAGAQGGRKHVSGNTQDGGRISGAINSV